MKLEEFAKDPALMPSALRKSVEKTACSDFITIRVQQIRAAASNPDNIPASELPALRSKPNPDNIPASELPALRSKLNPEISQALAAYSSIKEKVKADSADNKLLPLSNKADDGTDYYLQGKPDQSDTAEIQKRRDMLKKYRKRKLNDYMRGKYFPGSVGEMRDWLVCEIVWRAVAIDTSLLAPTKIDTLHLLVDRRLRVAERMLYDINNVDKSLRAWNVNETNKSGELKDGWYRMFEYPRIPQDKFLSLCKPQADYPHACTDPALENWYVKGKENLSLVENTRLNPAARQLWERPPAGDIARHDYTFFLKTGASAEDAIEKLFMPSENYKDRNLLYCDHVCHVLNMESLLWVLKKHRPAGTSAAEVFSGSDTFLGKVRIHYPFFNGPPFLAGWKDVINFEFKLVKLSELQIGDYLIAYNHPAYNKVKEPGDIWRLENAFVVSTYPELLFQGHGIRRPKTLVDIKLLMIKHFNKALFRLRRLIVTERTAANTAPIDLKNNVNLVRRGKPIPSGVKGGWLADWWIRWEIDIYSEEFIIATSPERSSIVKEIQKIEYEVSSARYAYFPLWEIRQKRIKKMLASPRMIAAWTWYSPLKADRDKVPVIRPRII